MDPALFLLLFTDFLVLLFSALASMTEAAFLSLPAMKAQQMAESDRRLDRTAGRMRLKFARPLATIVVINNIANIGGASITGFLAAEFFKSIELPMTVSAALGVHAALLTLIVILAGEIVPKTIGERHNEVVCRMTAVPVIWLQRLLTPILWLVGLTQKPFMRVGSRHVTSEEEISRLTSLGAAQGAIEELEGDLIQNVLKLDEVLAESIMVPRVDMVTFEAGQKLGDLAEELGELTRSRIPVFRESRDNIVAILDRADALHALADGKKDVSVTDPSVSFKPFFVPESMPADHLLVALQRRTQPMAIVVGDYGETVGLVTLEDVIEEIVGEILDEGDVDAVSAIERDGDDALLCSGRTEVGEVNAALSTDIPNHRTLAGLLLDEMERIPRKGDSHEAHGVLFTIAEATVKAIVKVHVRRLDQDDDESDEPSSSPERARQAG